MSLSLFKNDTEAIVAFTNVLRPIITPLSLLGATIMFILCLRHRPMTISIKFIATLAFSDILYSLTGIMSFFSYPEASTACMVEGVGNSFFFNFSTLTASSIAILNSKLASFDVKFNHMLFYFKTLLINLTICCICSLGIFVVPCLRVFKVTEGSCYETFSSDSRWEEALYFMYSNAPIYGGLIVSIVYYFKATRIIRYVSVILLNKTNVETTALMLYPMVLFITLLPYITLTLIVFFGNIKNPAPAFVIIDFISTRSIGLFNAMTYGIQRSIYKNMQKTHEEIFVGRELTSPSITSGEPTILSRDPSITMTPFRDPSLTLILARDPSVKCTKPPV